MHFEPHATYHVYNRSNEVVFKSKSNYLLFLTKIQKHIKPYANILAWCLMPNHFHILLQAKPNGCQRTIQNNLSVQQISLHIGHLISSYTQAFNKDYNRRGKLFAHKTKAKCLNDLASSQDYGLICFNYIHQNPLEAGLSAQAEEWTFSSYSDYCGNRNGSLVQKDIAEEMFAINLKNFKQQSKAIVDDKEIAKLY